jgi:hypothetical protein
MRALTGRRCASPCDRAIRVLRGLELRAVLSLFLHPANQRRRLRIRDFADLAHLAERMMADVPEWNVQAHPFNWSTQSEALVMAKCEAHSPRIPAA